MGEAETNALWSEAQSFEVGQVYKFEVGALQMYISFLEKEWQFRHSYATENETDKEKKLNLSTLKNLPRADLELSRYIHAQGENSLKFKPRMANRSIVAKPYQPIFLPPDQTVTIYISTPLWLAIYSNNDKLLTEIPSYKLSDTWFGPKPHIGELCYSSRFSGRVDLDSLPRRVSRVITPVRIRNESHDSLKLEKVSIPSEYLEVYLNADNELWTPALSLLRATDKNTTKISIDKVMHPEIQGALKVAEPRKSDQSGLVSKTLDMFFK